MTLEEALEASGAEPVNDIFLINPENRTISVPASEERISNLKSTSDDIILMMADIIGG